MNNNLIYLGSISLAIIVFVLMYNNPEMKPKYVRTFKSFSMIILITAIMYIYNQKFGLILGFTSAYVGITNFDKDFSGRFMLESVKIIIMELLIGVGAYLCSYNKILTIIVSLIIIFLMYYFFTHKGKASRVRGFLFTYILLINEKIPRADYGSVFEVLIIAILISIAFYYFFSRDSYFKDSRILDPNIFKKKISFSNLFVEEDKDEIFKKEKFKHAIISTILMTASIFYMAYYGNAESVWIIIVASAILVIDPITSEKMIIDRTLGTIIGAIVFLVAHNFITNPALIIVLIFVSLFFFMFPMAYYKRMVFITYFVLEIHSMISNYSVSYLVNYRIGFTLIAGVLVLIIIALDKHLKEIFNKFSTKKAK